MTIAGVLNKAKLNPCGRTNRFSFPEPEKIAASVEYKESLRPHRAEQRAWIRPVHKFQLPSGYLPGKTYRPAGTSFPKSMCSHHIVMPQPPGHFSAGFSKKHLVLGRKLQLRAGKFILAVMGCIPGVLLAFSLHLSGEVASSTFQIVISQHVLGRILHRPHHSW